MPRPIFRVFFVISSISEWGIDSYQSRYQGNERLDESYLQTFFQWIPPYHLIIHMEQIDRTEITAFKGKQWLLTAGIGTFYCTDMRHRIFSYLLYP